MIAHSYRVRMPHLCRWRRNRTRWFARKAKAYRYQVLTLAVSLETRIVKQWPGALIAFEAG
jgi:hypothetical protein